VSLDRGCATSNSPVDRRIVQIGVSFSRRATRSGCQNEIGLVAAESIVYARRSQRRNPGANAEHRQMKIAAATRAVGSRGLILEPARAYHTIDGDVDDVRIAFNIIGRSFVYSMVCQLSVRPFVA
jgi:hypothetical protein